MNEAAIPFVKASACGNDFLIIDGMYALAFTNGMAASFKIGRAHV